MLSGVAGLLGAEYAVVGRCTGRACTLLNSAALDRRYTTVSTAMRTRLHMRIKLGYVRVFVHLPVRPCQALQYME